MLAIEANNNNSTIGYVKDSRYNQPEAAPAPVALDTTNTSTEHQKINKAIQSKTKT